MKTYRFVYNNNDSRYQFECDADAMMNARDELKMLHNATSYTDTVHVWEQKPDGKYRYVASYSINNKGRV